MYGFDEGIEHAIDRYKERVRNAEKRALHAVAGAPRPAFNGRLYRKAIHWLGAQWAGLRRVLLRPGVEQARGEQPAG